MTDTPQGPVDPEDEHASPPSEPPETQPGPTSTPAAPAAAPRPRRLRRRPPAGLWAYVPTPQAPGPPPVVPPVVIQQGYAPSPGVAQGYPQPVVNPYGRLRAGTRTRRAAVRPAAEPRRAGGVRAAEPVRRLHPGTRLRRRATDPPGLDRLRRGRTSARSPPSVSAPSRSSSTPRCCSSGWSRVIGFILLVGVGPHRGLLRRAGQPHEVRRRRRARRRGRRAHRPGRFLVTIALWLWNRVFRMGRTGQSSGSRRSASSSSTTRAGSRSAPGCASCASGLRHRQPGLLPVVPVDAVGHRQGDAGRQGRALHGVRPPQAVTPRSPSAGPPAGIRPVRARSTRGCCAPR